MNDLINLATEKQMDLKYPLERVRELITTLQSINPRDLLAGEKFDEDDPNQIYLFCYYNKHIYRAYRELFKHLNDSELSVFHRIYGIAAHDIQKPFNSLSEIMNYGSFGMIPDSANTNPADSLEWMYDAINYECEKILGFLELFIKSRENPVTRDVPTTVENLIQTIGLNPGKNLTTVTTTKGKNSEAIINIETPLDFVIPDVESFFSIRTVLINAIDYSHKRLSQLREDRKAEGTPNADLPQFEVTMRIISVDPLIIEVSDNISNAWDADIKDGVNTCYINGLIDPFTNLEVEEKGLRLASYLAGQRVGKLLGRTGTQKFTYDEETEEPSISYKTTPNSYTYVLNKLKDTDGRLIDSEVEAITLIDGNDSKCVRMVFM